MKKGGIGGANTKTGIIFEKNTDLSDEINKYKDFKTLNDEVFYKEKKIAILCKQHKIYKTLCQKLDINWENILSQKLLPDEAIFFNKEMRCVIIEKKYQTGPGSVEEKLQTCEFKLSQYKRLLEPSGVLVELIYVINKSWFDNPRFRDVLQFMKKKNCPYYFDTIPLDAIFGNYLRE